MKLSYRVLALVGLAFSIFIAATALDLRLMTRLGPGPGFFPFSLAVLFGGIEIIRARAGELGHRPARELAHRRVAVDPAQIAIEEHQRLRQALEGEMEQGVRFSSGLHRAHLCAPVGRRSTARPRLIQAAT